MPAGASGNCDSSTRRLAGFETSTTASSSRVTGQVPWLWCSFAPAAETKVTSLAQMLAGSSDYKISIESHTDNKGTPDELQTLTQERAQAIMDRLVVSGAQQDRVEAKGMGANLPIVANTTVANRAKNRRVEIVLTPML